MASSFFSTLKEELVISHLKWYFFLRTMMINFYIALFRCSHNTIFLHHQIYHTIYMAVLCLLISVPQTMYFLRKGAVLPFLLEEKDCITSYLHCWAQSVRCGIGTQIFVEWIDIIDKSLFIFCIVPELKYFLSIKISSLRN